ncbi:MAG: hypothetical protein K2M06_09130 [Muribaculaceae bacterium]|nr:hypothetical protein [Muribaculaceae bacterium]
MKLYYDDNDHRKGYYYVRRPRGPYPVGYPREQIVKDMEDFERLVQEQKAKAKAKTWTGAKSETKAQATRPTWWDVLMMTPKEYMEYRRRRREGKN